MSNRAQWEKTKWRQKATPRGSLQLARKSPGSTLGKGSETEGRKQEHQPMAENDSQHVYRVLGPSGVNRKRQSGPRSLCCRCRCRCFLLLSGWPAAKSAWNCSASCGAAVTEDKISLKGNKTGRGPPTRPIAKAVLFPHQSALGD